MDFVRPLQAVIPGVQGRLLAVLAQAGSPLTLRTLADLAGVSPAQASRVLPRLVNLGLVERSDFPPAALFSLIRENLAARAVLNLVDLRASFLVELRLLCTALDPPPVSVVLYGSLARGEAGPESDIDVLVVRPVDVVEDDETWGTSLSSWVEKIEILSGNQVNLLEVSEKEITSLIDGGGMPWSVIAQEGVLLSGRPLGGVSVPADA